MKPHELTEFDEYRKEREIAKYLLEFDNKEQRKAFKRECLDNDKTMREVLIQLIKNYNKGE